MIKQKTALKLLVLLMVIGFMVTGCQKDDETYEDHPTSKTPQGFTVRNLSLADIQQKQNIQQALVKLQKTFDVNKQKSHTERSGIDAKIDASDGSFTLLTERIVEVATDSTTTYAFLLETPTDIASEFENFVLEVRHDTLISYHLLKYRFLEESTEEFPYAVNIQAVSPDLVSLDDLYSQTNKMIQIGNVCVNMVCITSPRDFECGWVIESVFDCPSGPGGGSTGGTGTGNGGTGSGSGVGGGDGGIGTGTSSGGGGSTGTGGTGTGNTGSGGLDFSPAGVVGPTDKDKVKECLESGALTQAQQSWLNNTQLASGNVLKRMATAIKKSGCHVARDIILSYIDDNITQSFDEYFDKEVECYGLQALTDNTDFQSALTNLKNALTNPNTPNPTSERGYEVSRTNNVLLTNFVLGNYSGVYLNHGGNIIGGMHTHPGQGDPMFSGEDIYKLMIYYQSLAVTNPNVSQHDVFSVVVTPNGTYMVKIRDFAVLRKIFGSGILGNSIFRAQKNLHNKILRYTNKRSNENDYLRSFLLAFKELKESNDLPKTPVFLYKLNEGNNTFEKVNLNVQDNPVTLPCN